MTAMPSPKEAIEAHKSLHEESMTRLPHKKARHVSFGDNAVHLKPPMYMTIPLDPSMRMQNWLWCVPGSGVVVGDTDDEPCRVQAGLQSSHVSPVSTGHALPVVVARHCTDKGADLNTSPFPESCQLLPVQFSRPVVDMQDIQHMMVPAGHWPPWSTSVRPPGQEAGTSELPTLPTERCCWAALQKAPKDTSGSVGSG